MSEDTTARVRPGEELDTEKLRGFLQRTLSSELGELAIEQFPGGHSNLTYLLRAGDRELVLRRPPFGSKVKSAHDMSREFRILSNLAPLRSWAPRPIAFCNDPAVLGCDFYLMERIHGVVLRRQPPGGTLDPATARRLCETLIDTLVDLHAVDWRAARLDDFGKPDGYVERQVTGWSRRYLEAKTSEVPAMPRVSEWLASHLPTSPPPTVLHNDFKFDNLVYDSDRFERVVGVLDWEMATIGDPLMDLGTALCYWVEPGDPDELKFLAFAPTMAPGMLTRAELAARYAEKTGRPIADIVFYYVFGLFKTAVVVQQIFHRYQQGLTKDPRFAALEGAVPLFANRAECAIAERRV